MSRTTNITTAWALVTLLTACAGELHRKDLENRLAGMPSDAQLELLAQQTAQYPDDLEIKGWYMSLRRRLTDEYLTRATVAYRAGDAGQALEWARRAQQSAPGDDRPRSMIVWIERQAAIDTSLQYAESIRIEKPDEALSIVSDVLSKQPDNTRARRLRDELLTPRARDLAPKLSRDLDQPITVQFRDQPLISIFELVSNITGLNFTFDRDVQSGAPTTIYASSTPVRQVLNMVLQANQLSSKVVSGNSILIYPRRPDKETEYRDLAVRTFYLENAQAAQVLAVLKQMVKTRDAVLDERTNAIILRDAPDTVKVAERIISALDVTPAEVVIEAQILEVSAADLLQLGVQYPSNIEFALQPQPTSTDTQPLNPNYLTLEQLRNLNSSDILVRIGPLGINFLQTHGLSKTLANPQIRVRNREKAKVLIGDRLPVVTTTLSSNFSSESVNYQDVGLTLEVAPVIAGSDEVQVKLRMEVSNVTDTITTSSGLVAYQIGTRTAETVMSVRNNETQMLAGLLQRNERATGSGLPGLSRIPFFDRIFGSRANDEHQTELVLLLTPRIVRNQAVPPGNVVSFDSGTDTRITTERDIAPAADGARTPPPVLAPSTPAAPPATLPPAPPAPPSPAPAPAPSEPLIAPPAPAYPRSRPPGFAPPLAPPPENVRP
ncbi:secretin N-terminal domain-containing protein [Caballeronia ptereochthonis]|uniref:Type II and III secretion system protein n=1 Tax=Caballeronia ptereochthonis TaxID=1777144 RepID=A0A157ZPA2_9BURK|nr:secretin N-terminal domain-containing protein [Caballeronia ptereochthonis]SAK47311.1 type II and III secretion system protein [Caballeronia ptereochthonis]